MFSSADSLVSMKRKPQGRRSKPNPRLSNPSSDNRILLPCGHVVKGTPALSISAVASNKAAATGQCPASDCLELSCRSTMCSNERNLDSNIEISNNTSSLGPRMRLEIPIFEVVAGRLTGGTIQFTVAGIVNTNVLPRPSLLSTQILPPCCSTICFAMDKPRPAPK